MFFIYKEIQMGPVAKSYRRKCFLIYEEMCKYLTVYEGAVSLMTLQPIPSEFPYTRGKFYFIIISVPWYVPEQGESDDRYDVHATG